MKIRILSSLAAVAAAALVAAPLHAQDSTRAAAPAAAPAAARPTLPVDRIVAIVGDQPILMSNVQEIIYQRRAQGMPAPADSAALSALVHQVINELVDEELLIAKAGEEKIELTDDEVNAQVDRQIKSVRERFKTELEYREALKANGLGSPEEYRKGLVEQARRSALQERVIAKMRQD